MDETADHRTDVQRVHRLRRIGTERDIDGGAVALDELRTSLPVGVVQCGPHTGEDGLGSRTRMQDLDLGPEQFVRRRHALLHAEHRHVILFHVREEEHGPAGPSLGVFDQVDLSA